MDRLMCARWLCLPLFLLISGVALARGQVYNGDMWIVELEDAPTATFAGDTLQTVTAAGGVARKRYAATSPSVTGADRLRVDAPEVIRYAAYLDQRRERVLDSARASLGRNLEPSFVYRHLANGFATRMTEAEARVLEKLPGVKSVRRDIVQYVQTDVGPAWLNAPQMWTGSTGAPNPNRGEGMVLGVIDTGVNWESSFFDLSTPGAPAITNPRGQLFGLCDDPDVKCSDKLIGVYDFTEEGTKGFDPDGHGSHVASTAVGIPLSFSLDFGSGPINFSTSGVAPNASFISYKACQEPEDDANGGFECRVSATGAALEQAIADEIDVVNFSIGGPAFDPWSSAGNQSRFLNLRDAGIVPVTSAGNSGPADGTVGSPANVPWVMAVANAEHGRILANQLVNVSGGTSALGVLVGEGITGGTGTTRTIVHAADFGNALCGTGPAELGPECGNNTGASNPFPPNTFNGEIVVCDRGIYGRVEKGRNLELAGAGGMILANAGEFGESTSADRHCLPAMHVGASDGDRLRDWLADGDDHRGRLTGTDRFVDQSRSGRLSSSSSRGPAEFSPDVMKPNVTGPGTNILAASTETDAAGTGPGVNAADQIGFLTGTSMSSPHVAGAALLLRAAHPSWEVDDVITALETTAEADAIRREDNSPARIVDAGAGAPRVDQAARIGLTLRETRIRFNASNPALSTSVKPGDLNLPGIFSESCVSECSFLRTLTALSAGFWTVETEGDLDISVTPTSFSLASGEQQQIEITIRRGSVNLNEIGDGSVLLTPATGNLAPQRLPASARIAAGELPEPQQFFVDANRGREDLVVEDLLDVDELVIRTSALVRPEPREPTLVQDPTGDDPFDGEGGTFTELIDVPPGALLLQAETFDSTSGDIDLFVGRDDNGDGVAQEAELVCASISSDDLEVCRIELPQSGTWWVMVQNWAASQPGEDDVPFEFAVLTDSDDPSLTAVAPGRHAGGDLTLPVYWDQPEIRRTDRWWGVVAMASSPDETADIGMIPLTIRRFEQNQPVETALFNDVTTPIALAASSTHDRLYIDLPVSAARLQVEVEGDLDQVDLRRLDFDQLGVSAPLTPPPPASVLQQAVRSGDSFTLDLQTGTGETLEPGRYYVVLENQSDEERFVEVTPQVTELEPVQTARGLWRPISRGFDPRQGIDWQQGGPNSFVVWYTYVEDGTPVFYVTEGRPIPQGSSFYRSTLFRFTSNNERQTPIAVGEVQLTQIDSDRIMYAWRLFGDHGSEMLGSLQGPNCPKVNGQTQQLLGHWAVIGERSGGVTLIITDVAEAWVRYYYDNLGLPRWVISGETGLDPTLPGGNRMSLFDFRGFCPNCTEIDPAFNEIGTLERVFLDENQAREVLDFVSDPPLNTSVMEDREITRLSNQVACPN